VACWGWRLGATAADGCPLGAPSSDLLPPAAATSSQQRATCAGEGVRGGEGGTETPACEEAGGRAEAA
jgi:hypothetical protein